MYVNVSQGRWPGSQPWLGKPRDYVRSLVEPSRGIQAIHRAHRFARDRPLHVVRFLVSETVEERINDILESKRGLFDEYVEQAPSAQVQGLTRGELLRILEITPTTAGTDLSPHGDSNGQDYRHPRHSA